jgi:hypothetical protein
MSSCVVVVIACFGYQPVMVAEAFAYELQSLAKPDPLLVAHDAIEGDEG